MIQVQKFHSSFFSNFQNLPDALQFSKIPFLFFLFHSKIAEIVVFQNRPNMPYNSQKFHSSSSFSIPISKILQIDVQQFYTKKIKLKIL